MLPFSGKIMKLSLLDIIKCLSWDESRFDGKCPVFFSLT
jgi:hypothetical protein